MSNNIEGPGMGKLTNEEPNPVTADYSASRAKTQELLDKHPHPLTLEKIFGGKKRLERVKRHVELRALGDPKD